MDKALDFGTELVYKLSDQCLIGIVIIVVLMIFNNRQILKHNQEIATIYAGTKK
jgi:hypothetical protein